MSNLSVGTVRQTRQDRTKLKNEKRNGWSEFETQILLHKRRLRLGSIWRGWAKRAKNIGDASPRRWMRRCSDEVTAETWRYIRGPCSAGTSESTCISSFRSRLAWIGQSAFVMMEYVSFFHLHNFRFRYYRMLEIQGNELSNSKQTRTWTSANLFKIASSRPAATRKGRCASSHHQEFKISIWFIVGNPKIWSSMETLHSGTKILQRVDLIISTFPSKRSSWSA